MTPAERALLLAVAKFSIYHGGVCGPFAKELHNGIAAVEAGAAPKPSVCLTCKGSGVVCYWDVPGNHKCPDCGGTGKEKK